MYGPRWHGRSLVVELLRFADEHHRAYTAVLNDLIEFARAIT
jgi:hypothetical protein